MRQIWADFISDLRGFFGAMVTLLVVIVAVCIIALAKLWKEVFE